MEKMTFADRLNLAMKEGGFTQGSLAEAVGMAQPSVWKLTSGKASSSRRSVQIARVLGVRPEWLSEGIEPMREDGATPYNPNSTIPPQSQWGEIDVWDSSTPLRDDEVEVPFLRDIELAAGDGSYCEEDYNGFKLRFSKSTLRRVGARTDGSGVICFPARGNSMEPNIPDGTTVAVNIDDKKIVDGKIYAINENNWKRVKLLYRVGPDTVSIRSYNKEEYEDEVRKLSEVEIIGRVFWWSVLDY
ncbi:XRE family transcriptional regulator [Yersinia enterocolitica]|uniref:XRE family transcriptional regulator n=1 Tax=Yersinia massiliensis TaxID=419257 RepID=UPI001CFCFBFF|nr:helix-turn-helix transcriptional regulator [Yersinia massiliensis]MCB5320224.1 helix-turn-helix transcriptional regulator [Yersinia massiliensis]